MPHWLPLTDDYLRSFLARPELVPLSESCPAELALHAALVATPACAVAEKALQAVRDPDARESYRLFLRFRDGLLAAGSLEAYYMGLFRDEGGRINIPPLFIDLLVQAIAGNLLASSDDAFEHRAADMLYLSQRISAQHGQVLSGDQATLDMLSETGGVGDIGRFLFEAGAPMASIDMQVLGDENAADFFRERQGGHRRHHFLLDLTHEVTHDLSHGLIFKMTRARSGLKALSAVLEKWVWHFLGVAVTIRPLQKIALLNDLYEDREVDAVRLQLLVSLFRLDFANPLDMRADVAGKPVYLGLMMNAAGIVKLKPQNLLINLPLQRAM